MTRGVLVLGMHRSGTSAVAGLLRLLGLDLLADDVLPADRANPKGYWESSSLLELNDRILDALGYEWTRPPAAGPTWDEDPALLELAATLRPALPERFERGGWVWKDPRTCLTFPYWLRATDLDPVLVLVHRDPLEVAASLATRDGIERPLGLALWERYVRHALAAAGGRPTLVTGYAELLDDPVAWAESARAFLAEHGVGGVRLDPDAVSEFVDAGLRRERSDPGRLERELGPQQLELARTLEGLNAAHRALAVELPAETPGIDGLFARRRRDEIRALERTVAELQGSRTYRYTAAARWLAGRLPGLRLS